MPPTPNDPMAALTAQWLDLWQRTGAWAWGNLAASAATVYLADPRRLRSAWLAELSRTTDRYLRSGPFLDWMRTTLTAVPTAARSSASSSTRK